MSYGPSEMSVARQLALLTLDYRAECSNPAAGKSLSGPNHPCNYPVMSKIPLQTDVKPLYLAITGA